MECGQQIIQPHQTRIMPHFPDLKIFTQALPKSFDWLAVLSSRWPTNQVSDAELSNVKRSRYRRKARRVCCHGSTGAGDYVWKWASVGCLIVGREKNTNCHQLPVAEYECEVIYQSDSIPNKPLDFCGPFGTKYPKPTIWQFELSV